MTAREKQILFFLAIVTVVLHVACSKNDTIIAASKVKPDQKETFTHVASVPASSQAISLPHQFRGCKAHR